MPPVAKLARTSGGLGAIDNVLDEFAVTSIRNGTLFSLAAWARLSSLQRRPDPMCGFAGYLTSRGATADAHEAQVRHMIAPIVHRGPDDAGTWVEPSAGLAFGFRRLAIIDLSAHGHQPMRSATGRFTMVFNGEVYNFATLRSVLERDGARFRGHSDSEVMLAAFERWGVRGSLPRFAGMFAFAVWDAEERCLHLARDRFGEKPLFIYAEPGYVAFGSELKSLVAGPSFDPALDPDALTAYLRFLYVPAPRTIYARATKLRPGHLMTLRDVGKALPASEAYWSVLEVAREAAATPFTGDDAEAIAEGERLIGEAAASRMVADVPIGAFLSGGIDSSTVVALMQERSARPVRTFSVGFDEADYDESGPAAAVAAHLGTDHSSVRLTGDDVLRLIPGLAEWFDEPHADPSQLPTYLICREARREVTVAVSGDGGDELFGGYNRYLHGERALLRAAHLGAAGRHALAAGINRLAPESWDRLARLLLPVLGAEGGYREPGQKLHKLRDLMRQPTADMQYRALVSAGFQDPGALVRGGRDVAGGIQSAFEMDAPLGLMERMMLADQLEYLPDDLLAKVDRVSMAVSLEVRVPLLDHTVAEFAWRLPRRFKVRGSESKWLLRQLLYARVPRALVDRGKMGFSVPIDRWLRGPLRQWAEALLSDSALRRSGAIEPAVARARWEGFLRRDGRVSGMGIWALLNFQAWQQRWT